MRQTLKVVTKRAPTASRDGATCTSPGAVAKHVKSNAIVYAKDGATRRASAPGRCRRVDSARVAARKAEDAAATAGWPSRAPGARSSPPTPSSLSPTACSPTIEAGATAVIQPGGSVRDAEVIAAADAAGVAMVFTGMRHFRH